MERLRDAIAKARAQRDALKGGEAPPQGSSSSPPDPDSRSEQEAWDALETVTLDDRHLAAQRIISWKMSDPGHVAFDVLRTRLLPLLRERGWRKVLITSPRKGCGKTTVATNLAISVARQAGARALLIDLDMKNPRLAERIGLGRRRTSIADWIRSDAPPQDHFIRIGENLAVALNTLPVRQSAEFLQDSRTAQRINQAVDAFSPVAVFYDLPPMLVTDDAIGFLSQVDCTLLVAAAGQTTAEEIDECERLLESNTNFLGVLLNKCELPASSAYRYYDYGESARAGVGG